jgi:hypothetical protein
MKEENMIKDKNETLTLKDIYTEVGVNYRYFLNWRHALLAGYLAVMYVMMTAYTWLVENSLSNLTWVVFLGGILVTACFWGIEYRIRDLYRSCTSMGAEIEKTLQITGIYTKLDDNSLINRRVTHSRILNFFFGAVTLGMFVGLIVTIFQSYQ